jgi:hypothetical protein
VTPEHVFRTERTGGERGDHGAVDAPAQSDDGGFEPALVKVITQSEAERFVQVRDVTLEADVMRDGCAGLEVDDGQVFRESFELGAKGSIAGDGQRVAIKNKLIVSADRIAVYDWNAMSGSDCAEHLKAAGWFAQRVG